MCDLLIGHLSLERSPRVADLVVAVRVRDSQPHEGDLVILAHAAACRMHRPKGNMCGSFTKQDRIAQRTVAEAFALSGGPTGRIRISSTCASSSNRT